MHKFGFFAYEPFLNLRVVRAGKYCIALSLFNLMMACTPFSSINKDSLKMTISEASDLSQEPDQDQSADPGGTISKASSSKDMDATSTADSGDSKDLIIEHYMGTRLQLSPKTCHVTAFEAQDPKQVRWRWQLEAAPGRCDFARDHSGVLRVVKTDKGNVISVASSVPESKTSRWCDTRVAVLVYSATDKGGLWSASTETSNMRMCPPQQWDEKMYHVMARHTRPLH